MRTEAKCKKRCRHWSARIWRVRQSWMQFKSMRFMPIFRFICRVNFEIEFFGKYGIWSFFFTISYGYIRSERIISRWLPPQMTEQTKNKNVIIDIILRSGTVISPQSNFRLRTNYCDDSKPMQITSCRLTNSAFEWMNVIISIDRNHHKL